MSNVPLFRRLNASVWVGACMVVLGVSVMPPRAAAQIPGLEAWADAVAMRTSPRWGGQRVDPPEPTPRPDLPVVARSLTLPLAVHAGPEVPEARVHAALEALELAWLLLERMGWATMPPDGGRGGTEAFDLYLTPHPEDADAGMDVLIPWTLVDAATTFAVMDPGVPAASWGACVTAAYAQALTLYLDPAEAEEWRRATGAWLAWMVTGEFGCNEAVAEQQQDPWRSWIAGAAGDGAGGALLLTMLSARHDRGTGTFIRDLWEVARQDTWEGYGLRASPDLWEALEATVEAAGEDLQLTMEDFAVARWFAGAPSREPAAPIPALRTLEPHAAVSHMAEILWDELPEHTESADPPLEPFGSGYVLVDTSKAPPDSLLRVWLRGEFGVRWSFVVIRLDAEDRELGRVTAPPRKEPRSYALAELLGETDRVLVVVTNLSSRLPDADVPDGNGRSFRLIVAEEPGTE